jgi:hypothetical protein
MEEFPRELPQPEPEGPEPGQAESVHHPLFQLFLRGAGYLLALFVVLSLALVVLVALGTPFAVVAVTLFGLFALGGGIFIVRMLKGMRALKRSLPSPERLAAGQAAWASPQAFPDSRGMGKATGVIEDPGWPTIPQLNPPARPGQALAHQLPTDTQPGCMLFAALLIALFWNGIVSAFLSKVIHGHLQGQGDWCLTVFLIPFTFIGIVLILVVAAAFYAWVVSLLVGSVRLEVSQHPLSAGARCEVLIEQGGLLRLRAIAVALVCEESATYTEGTRTRTETREVLRIEAPPMAEDMGTPHRCSLSLPPAAMHSFEARHNKIRWKFRVRGRAAGLLPYSITYPAVVYPASHERGTP